MKEYVARLTVKGIKYYVEGINAIDSYVNFFKKYGKFLDKKTELKIFQRQYHNGILCETLIKEGI